MLVEFKTAGDVCTALVSGRINTETAQMFQDSFDAADRTKKLVLDFADVEFISSAGLRVLVVLRKRFPDDKMEVVHVSDSVYEVFEMTGFNDMIPMKRADRNMSKYVHLSFKDFLKEKAEESKDAAAVIVGGLPESGSHEVYTWSDIDRLSQLIAKDLYDKGVRRGTHVGLMGMNSINWILTFFAIHKLGAIALLVNFNLKASEVQKISHIGDITHLCYGDIADSGDENAFVSVVTDPANSKITQTYKMSGDINFRDRAGEYDALEGRFAETVDSDTPAVVIFTSGSTGKPKAVLLSAFNLLNSAAINSENFHIGSDDVLCLVPPLFHIFGLVSGLLGNMIVGSTVVIPQNIRTATVLHTVATEKCTQLYSVPTLLLAIVANKSFTPEMVSSLRCVLLSGASATEQQIIELQKLFPNAFFATAYGLSEMAPVSLTAYKDTVEHVSKTIGKPTKNIEVRIIDLESGIDCPQGKSGEIVVRGYNTMVCYYRIDPSDQPLDEDGWLHTGDLGLIDEDGYIRFVGRAKELIIRGGENIAPREIAEVITQYPGIADAKVQGIPDDFYGEIVGASVVMNDGCELDTEDLKKFLSGKLAKYKMPDYIFKYDKFPMLPNGKVDSVGLKKDMNQKAAELQKKQ